MKEDFLHYLWKYKKVPLKTKLVTGGALEIISYGNYNTLAGPDFLNARLRIGGQEWAGNVEMHLKSSHWYAHHHEEDPAYRNVILHVVWEHDVEVFDTNNQPLATLELRLIIEENVVSHYLTVLGEGCQFIPCEKTYSLIPKITLLSWHERLWVERLEEKSKFIGELWKDCLSDGEKVLFLLLLKNFGGTVNGEAFLEIGKHLDFSIVRKERAHPLHLEALLLGAMGLLPEESEWVYAQEALQNYRYLTQKYQLHFPDTKLNFVGLRPQGFPTIRLSQLAQLYETHEGLFAKVIDVDTFVDFQKLLDVGVSSFWENHYTFLKTSRKQSKRISTPLAILLWINVIVPLKYFYQKTLGNDVSELLLDATKELPVEQNSLIEHFNRLGAETVSAFDSQVLLQQYKHYCKNKRCLDCAIGITLLGKKI